jgi:hypothetical protein
VAKRARDEGVVEPDVRLWRRERVAEIGRVKAAKGIDISRRQNRGNGPPADPAAAQPDERAQLVWQLANVKQIAWRNRVEVADEDMRRQRRAARRRGLMGGDRSQERAQLEQPPPLRPCGVNGAQMNPNTRQVEVAGRISRNA